MNEANVRETKDRILDAAERLVAQQGVAATSLRQITSEADVNLAAVNYHFQTKEELMKAVYIRRLGPVNVERVAMLDELEATYQCGKIPLEAILHAFIEPVVNLAAEMEGKGTRLGSMLGRIYTEPLDSLSGGWMKEMAPVGHRFGQALQKVLPALSSEEVMWRLWFTIGVIAHTLGASEKLEMLSGGRCDIGNREQLMRQMIAYAKAGLEAPKAS